MIAANPNPESAANSRTNQALPPRQEAAALALASGLTEKAAAEAAHANERTIRTWLADIPAFSQRIKELRNQMTERALGRLTDGMATAAETLRELSVSGKSEQVRLGAARSLLEMTIRLKESIDWEKRISDLESQLPTGRFLP